MLKGGCQVLKSSADSQSLKEQAQIFILFTDIKAARVPYTTLLSVNCIEQKQGGTSKQAMKKRRKQNVNSEGRKEIKFRMMVWKYRIPNKIKYIYIYYF